MGIWGVLGAGLIGGSIAADLLAAGERVLAYDPSERAAAAAEERGAELVAGIDELARGSEIVVCAVPGRRAAAAVLSLLEASSRCLVLDTAAPKARIVRRVEGSFREDALGRRYFPAYPCAGQPLFGWRAARPGLLSGQTIAFCLEADWEIDARALQRVFELVEITGGAGIFARPAEIDSSLARYVQMTRLLAAQQAELVLSDPLEGMASDPGFADLSAMAARDGAADTEAAIANRDALAEQLDELADSARDLAGVLRRRDAEELEERLRRGQFARARLEAARWSERDPYAIEITASAAALLEARGPARSLRVVGERLHLIIG